MNGCVTHQVNFNQEARRLLNGLGLSICSMKYALAFLALLIPSMVQAASASFVVRDSNGQPLADAVVTIHPASGTSGTIRFPWDYAMEQRNIQFSPRVLIVPVGATVRFPNRDRVRHHVYSFSGPARFEIDLYGRDETRSHRFTSVGTVPLGCNIHDQMNGVVRVVDTPYAAKTDPNGRVRIDGIPAGRARVVFWHAALRAENNESPFPITMPTSGSFSRVVTLQTRARR